MAGLDLIKQKKIDDIFSECNLMYENGDLKKSVSLLKMAWEELPNPKFPYDESYHIARYIAQLLLELRDFIQAREWAFIVSKCDPERADVGEKEFLIGQIAYEAGDELEAKKYIKVANQKSGGRCFHVGLEKYRKLVE